MSGKRKHAPLQAGSPPYPKRPRPEQPDMDGDEEDTPSVSTPRLPIPQSRTDPIFGQKHAFPGLDDPVDGDELLYGPPEDGIEYLRLVRSEANSLPTVFVAKSVTVTESGNTSSVRDHHNTDPGESTAESRHRGVYSGGVYRAVPDVQMNPPTANFEGEAAEEGEAEEQEIPSRTPQEIYYNLLRHRFLLVRSTLKCTPPASVIARLDRNHPILLPANSRKAWREWQGLLGNVTPQMAQIACMDSETVLRLLPILTRSLSPAVRSGDIVKAKRIGAWAWGLLARCREVGEMVSEDVAEIRELGKRAVKILVKIKNPEWSSALDAATGQEERATDDSDAEEEEELEHDVADFGLQEGEPADDDEYDPEELEAAKLRLQQRLQSDFGNSGGAGSEPGDEADQAKEHEQELKSVIFAMLDMIITVAGEFYGQRDLLEFRDVWQEGDDW